MGNCTSINRSKERLKMQSFDGRKTKTSVIKDCPSDPLSDNAVKSPVMDNGGIVSKSNRCNGSTPCRIPILKDGLVSSPATGHSSYKSVLSDRPPSSRIPVTSTSLEHKRVLSTDNDLDKSQSHESGFISDFSVTTSTYSHMNNESRFADNTISDSADIVGSRNRKSWNKPNSHIPEHAYENVFSPTNDNVSPHPILEVDVIPIHKTTSTSKSVSVCNAEDKLKRPQSLSTESEIMMHKSLSNRCSGVVDVLSPSVSMHEHSAVMQDVSSLKLMLHKLKRYLTQDGDERPWGGESINEGLFRLSSPSSVDIKSLSRDELEQRYEALCERNINLEKMLQSREKVIVQLLGDKQSALGEQPRRSPTDYHWPNLKLPNVHI